MGSLTTSHLCFLVTFLFTIHVLHYISPVEANNNNNGGFSAKLIWKNLPSTRRPSLVALSPVSAYLGQYLMEVFIGTPPVRIQGIADTGSDLTWTQCIPCADDCFKQQNPLFDPTKSSTYSNISCTSPLCHKLDTGVCSFNNQCNYSYGYGGGELTLGVLAQETLTLGEKDATLNGFIFGCGHNNTGTFNDHEMGIIGLGRGQVSLISQIGDTFGGKRFSICLVPFGTDPSISSKISFGSGSEVLGDGVVSTPLVTTQDNTIYTVTLKGISVGNTFLPFNSSSGTVTSGNMFMDTGTPPTILPQDLYDRLVGEVRKQVSMEPIQDDPTLGNQLCYKTATNLGGPRLTVHLEGANLWLDPIQTFIPPKDGVFCLGFTNTSSPGGIIGNFAQSNFLIGYDPEKQVISFKSTDCTKQ